MEKITSPTLVYHWVHPWLGWCEMTLEWLMDGFWHWGYLIIGIAGKSGVPFSMAVGNCPQDFIHFYSILQWTFIDRCGKPRCKAIVLSIYIYWRWFGWKFQAWWSRGWRSHQRPLGFLWMSWAWGSEDCDVALIGGNRPGNLGTLGPAPKLVVSGCQVGRFVFSSSCIKHPLVI